MASFSAGDIFFIAIILCVIHGIMTILGYVRRRKARNTARPEK